MMPIRPHGLSPTTLGERLLLARRRSDITAADMALRLRRSPNTISSWETDTTAPSYGDLKLWVTVCGAAGELLLGEDLRSRSSVDGETGGAA